MLEVVLDTNLIIDLEKKRPGYQDVQKIQYLHQGLLKICIPAIMATEKTVNGSIVKNYHLFKQYITNLGFVNTEYLRPPSYIDMSYLDYCILSGGYVEELLKEIHSLLFQNKNIEFDHREYCDSRGIDYIAGIQPKWKNAICDSIMLWSAVYYSKPVFITRDQNFHNFAREIEFKYGVKVKRPSEF